MKQASAFGVVKEDTDAVSAHEEVSETNSDNYQAVSMANRVRSANAPRDSRPRWAKTTSLARARRGRDTMLQADGPGLMAT